jgi:catechol 2,3-dioxygenase-like lactoylglutathione lyase family enzyme
MMGRGAVSGLGQVMQLAYAPSNIDEALTFWTKTMGVGPFFAIDHVKLNDVRYKGAPSDIDFSLMLAYWGDIQIELIQQHNDAPSIYKAWRDSGQEGVHHVCVLVADFAAAQATVAAKGFEILQEATLSGGGAVMYVDAGGGPGTIVEILKPADGTEALFDMIRDAARDWDGTDPVRRFN